MKVVFVVYSTTEGLTYLPFFETVMYVKVYDNFEAVPAVGDTFYDTFVLEDRDSYPMKVGIVFNRHFVHLGGGKVAYRVGVHFNAEDIDDVTWAENGWHNAEEAFDVGLI